MITRPGCQFWVWTGSPFYFWLSERLYSVSSRAAYAFTLLSCALGGKFSPLYLDCHRQKSIIKIVFAER